MESPGLKQNRSFLILRYPYLKTLNIPNRRNGGSLMAKAVIIKY